MDIDLIEKKIRELQILLATGGLAAHAALTGSAAHGAVSAPTPNQIITRDAAGRAQVVAPSVTADIARKDTVDAVQTNLTNHAELTNPHSATAAATADRLVLRDGAGRAQIVAPSVAADIATKGYVDGLTGLALLYIEDQKPAGTDGGSSVAGSWTQRNLNTILLNSISGASLASNRITLPAGTYFVEASAPAYHADWHRLKLYNYTDSLDIPIGTSEYAVYSTSNMVQTRAFVKGPFTLAAQKEVELRHRVQTARADYGFGAASNFAVIEVYSQIEIRKIA
jgi:hypothetical protein